ncbi:hypothetical protein SpCBS45565_g07332 [Spizellomyces sp. 'palustris']|nr:hypothetical protein SpCBS45565_g07332 [Spizellomyces sp. 'palustris']
MAEAVLSPGRVDTPTQSHDRIVGIDNENEQSECDSQDTVKSLERRIVELETQLKNVSEQKERELALTAETLMQKNDVIDVMRIKLNRYEFAIKEAILFLGKPMLNFEEWLTRGGKESFSADSGQAEHPRVASTISKSSNDKSLPAQMAEKQQAQQAANFQLSLTSGSKAMLPGGATPLEVQCMECLRLALNYLKSAQMSVKAVSQPKPPGIQTTQDLGPLPRLNGEAPHAESASPGDGAWPQLPPCREGEPEPPRLRTASSDAKGLFSTGNMSQAGLQSGRSYSSASSHERKVSAQKAAAALYHAATSLPEDDESDLATNPSRSTGTTPSTPTMSKCHICRDMMLQLHHLQDTIDGLKLDITDLADQLEGERAVRDRLQLSKDILDQELEELTAQLFDQANRMVIDEAKMRDELEHSNRQLRGELSEVMQNFQRRDDELQQLRQSLRALEAAKLRSSSVTNLTTAAGSSSPLGSQSSLATSGPPLRRDSIMRRSSVIVSPHSSFPVLGVNSSSTIPVDGVIFSEFQEHVKETMNSNSQQTPSITTQFFKRCMAEDVEPCLFYGYHLEGGGIFKQTQGLSTSSKKKFLENISRGWCEVVSQWATRSNPSLASKLSQSPSSPSPLSSDIASQQSQRPAARTKCYACTLIRDCDYKIRFVAPAPSTSSTTIGSVSSSSATQTSLSPDAAWQPLCRFCRDRILAVLDFFAFLSHLRVGVKHGATILAMFRQVLWLRRRMAGSRIGSTALFEGDADGNGRPEEGGDWEKLVQIMP